MGLLATVYSDLGRHREALVLKEKTLEFRRRVLPENDPQIGFDVWRTVFVDGRDDLTSCVCRIRNGQSCERSQ
jgi:hypothetical protein